jgi:hypothetical protein
MHIVDGYGPYRADAVSAGFGAEVRSCPAGNNCNFSTDFQYILPDESMGAEGNRAEGRKQKAEGWLLPSAN